MTDEPKQIQLVDTWCNRTYLMTTCHHACASHFQRRNYGFGIIAIALSTVVGTAVFASLEDHPHLIVQVAVGMLSILAAVFSILQTFLNYSERADKHRVACVEYGILMRELEQTSAFFRGGDAELEQYLGELRARWDELTKSSPVIPQGIWDSNRNV